MSATDKPWISFLKSNPEMFSDFLQWIVSVEDIIMNDIRTAIKKDDFTQAKLCEGQLQALDKLRSLSTIAEKEDSSHAEFQRVVRLGSR